MTITTNLPELALRSLRANWDQVRWEELPDDGNRYEVIDGVLYRTTAPSVFHQWIIRQIARQLFRQIDDQQHGITLWAPIGVFMPGCEPVQPDVLMVRSDDIGIIRDRRVYGIPALIVEVLSPSNPEQDLEVKRDAYMLAGVPEYWVVRPSSQDMIVFSHPDRLLGMYTRVDTIAPDSILISPTLPIQVQIADLFAGAPDTTL